MSLQSGHWPNSLSHVSTLQLRRVLALPMVTVETVPNSLSHRVYFGFRRALVLPMETAEPCPISLSHVSTLQLKVRHRQPQADPLQSLFK